MFDLFDFGRSDHPKKTFDVLTLQCSDFQGSDPLPKRITLYFSASISANNVLKA
jgi:hypothetical protein